MKFNTIAFPQALILKAATDAAYDAASAFISARIELAGPKPSKPVTAIHKNVIRHNALATSLAFAAARRA